MRPRRVPIRKHQGTAPAALGPPFRTHFGRPVRLVHNAHVLTLPDSSSGGRNASLPPHLGHPHHLTLRSWLRSDSAAQVVPERVPKSSDRLPQVDRNPQRATTRAATRGRQPIHGHSRTVTPRSVNHARGLARCDPSPLSLPSPAPLFGHPLFGQPLFGEPLFVNPSPRFAHPTRSP